MAKKKQPKKKNKDDSTSYSITYKLGDVPPVIKENPMPAGLPIIEQRLESDPTTVITATLDKYSDGSVIIKVEDNCKNSDNSVQRLSVAQLVDHGNGVNVRIWDKDFSFDYAEATRLWLLLDMLQRHTNLNSYSEPFEL